MIQVTKVGQKWMPISASSNKLRLQGEKLSRNLEGYKMMQDGISNTVQVKIDLFNNIQQSPLRINNFVSLKKVNF